MLVGADDSRDEEWNFRWNHNNVGYWYCPNTENKYYYTSENGWKDIERKWYIFDSRGYALENTWYYDSSTNYWYCLDGSCKMVRGSLWLWIDSACYAFDEHGKMYCNCVTPDEYCVDKSGFWINCIFE